MKKTIVFLIIGTFLTQSYKVPLDENSKIENYNSLKNYIEKKNIPIDLEQSLFLKKKSDFNKVAVFKTANFYKKDINKFSIPDVYLFNKNSILIDENALGGCIIDRPAKEGSDFYTDILKENKILKVENNTTECSLDVLKNSLCDYKGNAVYPFKENKACLIFVWAKNKTSRNALNHYINYTLETLQKSKEEVTIYFLNADEYTYQ